MPQPYTLEEVKEWFGTLDVLNIPDINQHLQSLANYGDNLVKSPNNKNKTAWTIIFNECLGDVKHIQNDNDYIRYKIAFEQRCGIPNENLNDELNAMTKKKFVILFAKVMTVIFTEEKRQEEERQEEERKQKNLQAAIDKSREYANRPITLDKDGCVIGEEEFNTSVNRCVVIGDRGGSKKKSNNKRIRRKRRDSRRNKTRKYKKRN